MTKSIFRMLILAVVAEQSLAANLIERDGRYEVNWTTGKIRFYGVGKVSEGDENFRAAEQRAWADGLSAAEVHLPKVMSGRLGAVDRASTDKMSKLAASTVSVSTTYFGDNRVKVLLEAPIQKVTPQLTNGSPLSATIGSTAEPLTIKLPRGSKPAAFVRVVDENGKELVNGNQVANSVNSGGAIPKWFKSKIDGDPAAVGNNSNVITGTSSDRGVIRVNGSEWKPAYTAAVTTGQASFVIE